MTHSPNASQYIHTLNNHYCYVDGHDSCIKINQKKKTLFLKQIIRHLMCLRFSFEKKVCHILLDRYIERERRHLKTVKRWHCSNQPAVFHCWYQTHPSFVQGTFFSKSHVFKKNTIYFCIFLQLGIVKFNYWPVIKSIRHTS